MNHYRNQIKASGILVVILSITLLYLAANMLISGVYNLKTQLFLENWQEKQASPTSEAWQAAFEASHKAQTHYLLKDAFLQENIGKVNQWKTFDKTEADKSVIKERQSALNAYRQQTQITPSWPKAWFNLLSIKIELNQFDSEFYHAFNIAKQSTKETPGMLTPFTIIGIQAYKQVNNPTKNQILKNILGEASISQQNSQNLRPLLQAYNLLGITCIYAKAIKTNTHSLCEQS